MSNSTIEELQQYLKDFKEQEIIYSLGPVELFGLPSEHAEAYIDDFKVWKENKEEWISTFRPL